MRNFLTYLAERCRWASKGTGGVCGWVSLIVGATIAVLLWFSPRWFHDHISDRVNAFILVMVPLLAGASVFLVRWFVSSYPIYMQVRRELDTLTDAKKEERTEAASTEQLQRARELTAPLRKDDARAELDQVKPPGLAAEPSAPAASPNVAPLTESIAVSPPADQAAGPPATVEKPAAPPPVAASAPRCSFGSAWLESPVDSERAGDQLALDTWIWRGFEDSRFGTTTCSKYLETRNLKPKDTEVFVHWMTGFITAYNWMTFSR